MGSTFSIRQIKRSLPESWPPSDQEPLHAQFEWTEEYGCLRPAAHSLRNGHPRTTEPLRQERASRSCSKMGVCSSAKRVRVRSRSRLASLTPFRLRPERTWACPHPPSNCGFNATGTWPLLPGKAVQSGATITRPVVRGLSRMVRACSPVPPHSGHHHGLGRSWLCVKLGWSAGREAAWL
jgi:hypothetical protein